jgi:hypothetical protein
MAGLNRVWESPLTLPVLHELGDPQAWIDRVGVMEPVADIESVQADPLDETPH